MKIVTLSDTHERHKKLVIPEGDVLVVAGDVTEGKLEWSAKAFNKWLGTLPFKHIVMIAGNHDWFFQKNPDEVKKVMTNVTYLYESGCEIDGVKFWGSPWTPFFLNWAFNIPPGKEEGFWKKIPDDVDVLITHGPPYGILDYSVRNNISVGCVELGRRVMQIKPKVHIFGHIHYSYGIKLENGTTFVNTSICDEAYNPVNQPHVIEV